MYMLSEILLVKILKKAMNWLPVINKRNQTVACKKTVESENLYYF